MNCRGQLIWGGLVDDEYNREIIIDFSVRVRDLENLTVLAGLRVGALDCRPFGRRSIGECPLVPGDLSRNAPRFGSVQKQFVAGENKMVRSGYCDDFGLVLP